MKKHQIIIYVFLIVFFVTVFIVYKVLGIDPKIDEYFVFSNSNNYGYSKKHEFYNISDDQIEKSKMLFNTYVDGSLKGKFYLSKINVWNLFDQNSEYVSYDGSLFAYAGNTDVKTEVPGCHKIDENDKKLLKEKFNVKSFESLVNDQSCDVDLNADGQNDKIIAVSNNSTELSLSDSYNIVITVVNKKISVLVEEHEVDSPNLYEISHLLNIGDKNEKYIILKGVVNYDGDIESYKSDYSIYEYKKGKYQQVKIKELKNK